MSPKKTLSNWLTNRYLLIIRNEENFAEKKTVSFNYARLILLATAAFIVTLVVSVYIVTVVLEEWLDPRFAMMQSNRQLVGLTMKIDSLEYEIQQKDQYYANIQRIIGGDISSMETMEQVDANSLANSEIGLKESIQPIDSQFRAEFENQEIGSLTYETYSYDEFREMYLFTPLEGVVAHG